MVLFKSASALAAILATCWLIYRASQCVFFFTAVKRGENQLVFAGSCPFLQKPEHVLAVHRAFRPTLEDYQLDLAGRGHADASSFQEHASSTTSGQRNRTSLQQSRMQSIGSKIHEQQEYDIVVGFGITLAGQTRTVTLFATSDSLKKQLMESSAWAEIQKDLQGLTPPSVDQQILQGK
jgi:hypothetical protein